MPCDVGRVPIKGRDKTETGMEQEEVWGGDVGVYMAAVGAG